MGGMDRPRVLTVRMPSELHAALYELSCVERRSMESIARQALREAVGRNPTAAGIASGDLAIPPPDLQHPPISRLGGR